MMNKPNVPYSHPQNQQPNVQSQTPSDIKPVNPFTPQDIANLQAQTIEYERLGKQIELMKKAKLDVTELEKKHNELYTQHKALLAVYGNPSNFQK